MIVKAQVHAGGRGKAGGVKFAATADEAVQAASGMLGTADGDASDRAERCAG